MKKLILALACSAALASCVKKEDKDPIDVSKTTFVMDGKWQLKVYTWLPDVSDPTSSPVDVYTPLPGCRKDNFYIFNTKTRVSLYDNLSKCAITDPDSTVYGYTLTNDDKYLTIFNNPDDANHTNVLAGDITYPSIDTFVVTYLGINPQDTTKTSRYTEKYAKIQ